MDPHPYALPATYYAHADTHCDRHSYSNRHTHGHSNPNAATHCNATAGRPQL